MARGFARRTARDARTTLTTLYGDAVPRYVQVNPAQRKRGKGRKGQRRIERNEHAEKVWATPLQVLLIAERLAVLTGRDEDLVMGLTGGYTGMRWSEVTGLQPDYVLADVLDIQWKLYELGGHFYRGQPKDGQSGPLIFRRSLPNFSHGTRRRSRAAVARAGSSPRAPDPHRVRPGARALSTYFLAPAAATTGGQPTANATSTRPPTAGIPSGRTGRRGPS